MIDHTPPDDPFEERRPKQEMNPVLALLLVLLALFVAALLLIIFKRDLF